MARHGSGRKRSYYEKVGLVVDTIGWLLIVIGLAGPAFNDLIPEADGFIIAIVGALMVFVGLGLALYEA